MNKYLLRFSLILLIAGICLAHSFKAIAQSKEEFDNLIFFVPQGLTISKTTNSVMLSDAAARTEENFSITINKSTFSLKKIEKSFPVFWKESLTMDGFDAPAVEPQFIKFTNSAGWNCFRGGKTVQYSAQSPPQYYHLTVLKYLGVTTRIITRAGSEELFMRKIPLLMGLIASIDFKKTPQQQNVYTGAQENNSSQYPSGSTPSSNTGYNTGNSNTSVVPGSYVLYMSVQGDLLSNAELSILNFFPDGTVYTDIPEKGFANFNLQEQKTKTPETFGTYTSSGSSIIVKTSGNANGVSYNTTSDRTLQSANNPALVYKKIATLDNYHLEGPYIKKQENNGITITFTKDGRFTDSGLIKALAPNYNGNTDPGNGNYTITQNSLLLHYSDGRTAQLCMYIMPEDYQQGDRPSKILINNYVLTRL